MPGEYNHIVRWLQLQHGQTSLDSQEMGTTGGADGGTAEASEFRSPSCVVYTKPSPFFEYSSGDWNGHPN
jgi:hypothetical protein